MIKVNDVEFVEDTESLLSLANVAADRQLKSIDELITFKGYGELTEHSINDAIVYAQIQHKIIMYYLSKARESL